LDKRIVVKFGGSNLKTKKDIARLIKVIKLYDCPIIIVISALYGITDILYKTLKQVQKDEKAIKSLINNLYKIKNEIIKKYVENKIKRKKIMDKVNNRIKELEKYLLGIHYIGEIPYFVEDMILSYGERLSSIMLESILNYLNINCKEILPEDIGLITDGEFGNATINYKLSEKNLKENLKDEKIYIIPGFYGISRDLKVTLFGRGGSDYSASAIANCIDASSVDIWKDISGFMSADPKLVKNAITINKLTYQESAELSYFGARILHPRTVEPLMEKGIPIRIFDINNFSDISEPLTTIDNKKIIIDDIIKSVTFSDDFGILKLIGPGVGIKPGIISRVSSSLAEARINIKSIITSQTCINILFSQKDLTKSYQIVKELGLAAVDRIKLVDKISLIAVVGEGMLEKSGIAARVFSAVSKHNINIQIISAGASPVAIYFIVEKKDKEKAIKTIHKEFFNENNKTNK